MTAQPATFESTQSVTTQLTSNSIVKVTPSGDANNTTQLVFEYTGSYTSIPYWAPSVSSSALTAINNEDRGNAVVTFKEGLEVQYVSLDKGHYAVMISGTIIDSGVSRPEQGLNVGIFPKSRH